MDNTQYEDRAAKIMNNESLPAITVLTDPIPHGRYFVTEFVRGMARTVRDRVRPPKQNYNLSKYRGHFAVTRSLVEGLRKSGVSFSYNPQSVRDLSETMLVIAGIRTLRQAIDLKKKGYIKKLFAGPNIVTFSTDADSILASPEIDLVITPCDWVVEMYIKDNPSLEGRCFAWPAGVDTEYWKPNPVDERSQILIFEKHNSGSVAPVEPYTHYMRQRGYNVSILKYGTYTHGQYLAELQRSQLMIGFVASESQGIAWAEAWAADVPTLLWKNTTNVYRGKRFRCSTAPYLRPENGLFFEDFENFKTKFAYWESHRGDFMPRAWALENMSDEVCASILYQKVAQC